MSDSSAKTFIQSGAVFNFLLLGICLVGLGLRWLQISGNLYSDEIWIITTALSPFPDFLHEIIQDWVHPPLFQFIVRGWVYLFGNGDLSVRFLAVAFGVLSIPLIYWLGKGISGRTTGLLTAALLAFSPVHIYHSQYGRHYSLVVFFVLLSMTAFLRVYYQPRNRGYCVFYIISNVLLVYTHYFGWLIVFCQGLFFLFRRFDHLKQLSVLLFIIVLSYIPWIFLVLKFASLNTSSEQQLVPFISWVQPPSFLEPLRTLASFNGQLPIPYQGKLGLLLLFGISLFSLRCVFHKDKYWEAILFLFSCVFVPFVLVFIFSYTVQPIWLLRGMLVCLPAYYLLIALGTQQTRNKKLSIFLMLIPLTWMCLASLFYIQKDHRMPYEQIASYLESESEPNMPILVEKTYIMNPIFFYYKGKGFLYELEENNTSIVPASHKCAFSQILSQIMHGGDWLILVTYTPDEKKIQSELFSSYHVVKQKEFFGYGEEGQIRKVSICFYQKNGRETGSKRVYLEY